MEVILLYNNNKQEYLSPSFKQLHSDNTLYLSTGKVILRSTWSTREKKKDVFGQIDKTY